MIRYRIDVLEELKNAGYSSYRLTKDKLFGSPAIQKMRDGEVVSAKSLDTICRLLDKPIEYVIEYVKD